MVKIVWMGPAVEDLKAIHEYIAKDSVVYAERVCEKLISRVDQL